MRVGIIGYGKMGKTIEKILKKRNHVISGIVDITNSSKIEDLKDQHTDVAIEFTSPESAFDNISKCISLGIPVVSGSTGWLDKKEELIDYCNNQKGSFFYASNFSLGVNIFFKVNEFLASIMNNQSEYRVGMQEIHHKQKLDKPSGTAITLAEGIVTNNDSYNSWFLSDEQGESNSGIPIESVREEGIPGTHSVIYNSEFDEIEIKHTARTREGFALGAVLAAEWLPGNIGYKTMNDFLKF